MAVEFSIEDRYVQHQRGLFVTVPRPSVGYVSCAWPPHRAPGDQNLHVVVDKLQKQVNDLQLLVRSLQSQAQLIYIHLIYVIYMSILYCHISYYIMLCDVVLCFHVICLERRKRRANERL